ncbi:peptide deformylase [Candidatus Vecturithrix granuli]|uniref:Peptide deformylase n=1 Tax=Vecturithrix granuli TaxID=1499967 RepID=A0A081C0A3_VECG1|nr:peptide deformylase [Candidatus Vecturithrix granuli]
MAILEIYTYPDPILIHKAEPVKNFDRNLRKLLDDMAETMYSAPGVGLAAPQVGVPLQAIVVDASPRDEHAQLMKVVNPVITFHEGQSVGEEGCLSVPGFTADVVRAARICVEGFDEYGKPVTIDTDTFLATVLQHEIDHLDGVLFIEHIGRLRRDMIKRKLKKRAFQETKKDKPQKQSVLVY